MKKTGLLLSLVLLIASCKKPELDPLTGYNSIIDFQNIQLYNLAVADSVVGTVNFEFLVASDTSTTPDIVSFKQSFQVKTSPYNQNFSFNTPEKTKTTNFSISFRVYGGAADSLHVDNFSYKFNNNTLYNKELYFTKDNSVFTTPTVSYNF